MLKNEKGYALAVVMAMSLIIIVVTMSIALSVRQKVKTAIELNNRSIACLSSYSAMNEVIFNVLTSTFTRYGMDIHKDDGSVIKWNLYGKAIRLKEGVTVRLRDVAGLISPLFHKEALRKLVEYTSKDSEKTEVLIDTLFDWQDKDDFKRLNGAESFDYRTSGYTYTPRNFYMQVIEEMKLLKGFGSEVYMKIKDDLVCWPAGYINYFTMSENRLKALLHNDSLVDTIIDLREKGELTYKIFKDMTGIQMTDDILFSPSNIIKVEIISGAGKAVGKIEAVIVKEQNERAPYLVQEWKR